MAATKGSKKNTTTKKSNSSPKKPTSKQLEAQQKARKKLLAIILFATGILVFFMTLIRGQNLWQWFHNMLLGSFGWSAYLIAPLLIYVAIMAETDKPLDIIAPKVWQSMVLVCLISGATQIFGEGIPPVSGLFRKISYLFSEAIELNGGGIISALTGLPFLALFGATGAKITIVLLIFVFVMIVTGATLYDLYRNAKKPVKKIEQVYTAHIESKEAYRAAHPELSKEKLKSNFNIDIPVDENVMPDHLVGFGKLEESKVKKQSDISPNSESFQKAKQNHDDYISQKQNDDEVYQPIEDLLPPAMQKPAEVQSEKKKDPIIEALINKAVQPPKITKPDDSFIKKVNEQQKMMGELTNKKVYQDLIQPPKVSEEVQISDDFEDLQEDFAFDNDFPEQQDEGFSFDEKIPEQKSFQEPPKDDFIDELFDDVFEEENKNNNSEFEFSFNSEPAENNSAETLDEIIEEPYSPPPIEILNEVVQTVDPNLQEELRINAEKLVDTLRSFGVQTRIVDIARGPAVTRYELQPSVGVKISKITGLADDIALNLAASGVRIEAPIPNKPAVGIEVPNKVVSTVSIREVIDSDEFRNAKSKLTVALGRDIAGNIAVTDLAKMPHTLIAGATGSGKSVCINSLIVSILYRATPDEVKLLMVDPKMVELGMYNGIPHLLVPVVTNPKKAAGALAWAVNEMENRYQLFQDYGVRDLAGFNRIAPERQLKTMPQIVIIIDELADLMMTASHEVEDSICRLAQKARAAGMYLVIATQRPSVDVITGIIKANIPSRIAFAVSSQIDSRTILDNSGAEKLLGRGDMLFSPVGASKPIRVQGCFVTDGEVERIINFIKQSQKKMTYDEKILEEIERNAVVEKKKGDKDIGGGFADEDEMLPSAIECVVEQGQASTSFLQRKLKLGYARAARLMDVMEEKGIVGPSEGAKSRQVLISKERWIEMKLISKQKAEDERRNY